MALFCRTRSRTVSLYLTRYGLADCSGVVGVRVGVGVGAGVLVLDGESIAVPCVMTVPRSTPCASEGPCEHERGRGGSSVATEKQRGMAPERAWYCRVVLRSSVAWYQSARGTVEWY
eukprot:642515-Rhodomonas_salina.1